MAAHTSSGKEPVMANATRHEHDEARRDGYVPQQANTWTSEDGTLYRAGQYSELHTTEIVPAKTGDEPHVNDPEPFTDRPTSAGTAYSGTIVLDDQEDEEAFLGTMTATPVKERVEEERHDAANGQWLCLQKEPIVVQATPHFSWSKATPNQMDLTGARRIPGKAQPRNEQVRDNAQVTIQNTDDDVVEMRDVDADQICNPPQDQQGPVQKQQTPAAPADGEVRMPKKKRTKHQQRQMPVLAQEQPSLDSIRDRGPHRGAVEPPQPTQVATEAQESLAEDRGEVQTLQHDDVQGLASTYSPHDQLRDDHESAAQVQHAEQEAEQAVSATTPPPTDQGSLDAQRPSPAQFFPPGHSALREAHQDGSAGAVAAPTSHPNGGHQQNLTAGARKRRVRKARAQPAVAPAESSKMNDLLHILAYEARQIEQRSAAKLEAAEIQKAEDQQKAQSVLQQLEEDLAAALEERDQLAAAIDKHNQKLEKYDAQLPRFKMFLDGIGTDLNKLRNTSNTVRRSSEALSSGYASTKQEQQTLVGQLRTCSERAVKLRNEAMQNCRELQAELDAANLRSDYLSQQLNEKAGMLAEERDRRALFEGQLASAGRSDDKVLAALKSNANDILDKLHLVHAALETSQSDKTISDLIQQTSALVQGVKSGTTEAVDHITSVKGLVETLSERVNNHIEASNAAAALEPEHFAKTLQTQLDESFGKLKADISQTENLLQQEAGHRETISALREQLKSSDTRISDLESQVSATQQSAAELRQQNGVLQKKLVAVEFTPPPATVNQPSPQHNSAVELEAVKAALQSAKAEVASKSEELSALVSKNVSIEDQVTTLQKRLGELQAQAEDHGREREDLLRKAKHDEGNIRQEMREHVEQVELKAKADARNELKKLSSERGRLQDHVDALKENQRASAAQIKQLQLSQKDGDANQREVDRLNKLIESQKHEIATLQSSTTNLQDAIQRESTANEKATTLSEQLIAEQTKVQAAVAEQLGLAKEVSELQTALNDSKLLEQRSKSELEKLRSDSDASHKALERAAAEAREEAKRAVAGHEILKASCDSTVKDTMSKAQRNIESLQTALAESKAETQAAKAEDLKYRAEVQHGWKQEEENHKQQVENLEQKIAEVEQEREEAQEDIKRVRIETSAAIESQRKSLLDQLRQLRERAEAAEAAKAELEEAQLAASRLEQPMSSGMTPSATIKPRDPNRPRKKADRNSNTLTQVSPIPAPEDIRPHSNRAAPTGSKPQASGPVVEDSQVVSDPFAVQLAAVESRQSSLSPEDYDILTIREEGTAQAPQVVEETQFFDVQSTFPEFFSEPASPVQSQIQQSALNAASTTLLSPLGRTLNSVHAGGNFQIHEDSQPDAESTKGSDPNKVTSSFFMSQAEQDQYTYKRPLPPPNSSSKRAQPPPQSSHTLQGDSYPRDNTSGVRRYQTPVTMGAPNSSHSSSPGFMNDSQTNARKLSTYQAPGNSGGKHRQSQSHSTTTVDPRLAARNSSTNQKRKSEGQIVEGYEPERKKRASAATGAGGRSTRSNAQLSIASMSAGPRGSSQYESSVPRTSSHMRTLGGASSRTTRANRKVSKSE
ncbi:uncharacterized protein LTR77_010367 [Saxophila tyrrhenica]|uniref:Uncharacterized protein n=1 Tax=Saxophila tyrrhenica TaxID=1690608 RepID=A0AAV9NYM8_9PEZI|nr:hypothetical protein LTR77_010367 [Saxophila tyrrhenica]